MSDPRCTFARGPYEGQRCKLPAGHEGAHDTRRPFSEPSEAEWPWPQYTPSDAEILRVAYGAHLAEIREPNVSHIDLPAWVDEPFRIKKLPDAGRNGV